LNELAGEIVEIGLIRNNQARQSLHRISFRFEMGAAASATAFYPAFFKVSG
jgi:hypothetical protein